MISHFTEDQVEIVARHLHALGWSSGGDYAEDFKPDVRDALEHLIATTAEPVAQGEVVFTGLHIDGTPRYERVAAQPAQSVDVEKVREVIASHRHEITLCNKHDQESIDYLMEMADKLTAALQEKGK